MGEIAIVCGDVANFHSNDVVHFWSFVVVEFIGSTIHHFSNNATVVDKS